MNSHSHHIQSRSQSVPLQVRPSGRSHMRNLARVIAALNKAKIQFKQRQTQMLALTKPKLQDDSTRPQFLMPRVEIIDDMNKERLVVKLEIPDVDPSKVKLRLHGNVLSIFGERTPDLSAVAEEYRDGLRFHSQSETGNYHRPKVILLGGGRVASLLSTQVNIPSNLNQSSQTPASPPPGHASDIEGHFINGMLILSWPKVHMPTGPEAIEEEERDITIPVPSSAPVAVNVQSANMEIDSSL